jgi:drug/metabolite transporter (DMT)-like permease
MRQGEVAGTENVGAQRDDSGVSVLGRLLWVGVVAGLFIGALAGVMTFAEGGPSYAVAGFSIGAVVGIVAGLAVQVLNAAVLRWARGARQGLGRAAMRRLLVPLPVAGALLVPWLLSTSGPTWLSYPAAGWPVMLVAGVLSAGVAWSSAPWSLEPIAPRRASPPAGDDGLADLGVNGP